jgi:WD40 repeat protein
MQTSLTSCSSLTGTTVATKPIIRFAVLTPLSSANFTWMPGSLIGYPQIVSPAGTQIYTVTADNGGCTAQATATVTIDPLSCSAATVSSPRCANTNFTVTANTTGGGAPFNYVWSDGVGGVYPNAATITANLPAGTYNFTCAVSDACGSNCNSDILSVVVDPAPGGTASGPATGETYQNLAFSLTGYTIGSTFQWQVSTTGCGGAFSNIGGATSDLLNATANGATTYYIRCFVTGANGCTTTSNCVTTVVTAAGDNVCSANTLNVGFNGPYTNVGATAEAGEVTPPGTGCNTQTGWCGTGYQINSVWFTFTPPTTGSYSFRLNPNNNLWDSEFALYSASACGDLLTGAATLIAANDDSSGSPYQSYITPVCLTGGTTYYFMVDGYNTTTNNNWGILVIQNTSVAVSINSTTNATCFVIPDAVSPSDCQALIDRAEAAGIQVTQPDYPPSYRNNDRLVFDDPGLAAWLYERLRPFLPAHLSDDRGELSCVGLNPRFRVCRYQDGQSFRIHQDGAHAQDADTVTRLTCQLYLNSAAAFSGGATRFYAGRKGPLLGAVRPVCGQVIVFDHLLWHDGEPVTDGCKYVLRSDVLYRRRQPKPSPAAPSDDNVLSGHRGYVWSVVALGPGRIASASRDRTIRIWHTSGPRPQCVAAWNAAAASVSCLAYHDGALWSGSRDHTVTRWDLATGVHAVVHRGDGAVLGFASQQQRHKNREFEGHYQPLSRAK